MLRDEALMRTFERLSAQSVDLERWLNRPDTFSYFMHSLGSAVARTLAGQDPGVLAVYAYEPSPDACDETMQADAELHLIVRVVNSTSGLEAFVAELDRALIDALKAWPLSRFAQRTSVLDVSLISEDDIRFDSGRANLLSAVFSPPLPLWRPDA